VSADKPTELLFLDVDDVLEIHALQLAAYGGAAGVRDLGLLESAVAQPQASFSGELVHRGVYATAAAYLFHRTAKSRPPQARPAMASDTSRAPRSRTTLTPRRGSPNLPAIGEARISRAP
jgi:hypothetical protein